MNSSIIFIRRNDDYQGWVRGTPYHEKALLQFQQDETINEVSIPYEHDLFSARFKKLSDGVYTYTDNNNNIVEIAFLEPAKAAYINRITDVHM